MGKRKLILHVGLPKAGSSTLQHLVHGNRRLAARHGLLYPEADPEHRAPKHQFMVRELLFGSLTRTAALLGESAAGQLMLSTEGLSNHLYDFPPPSLAAFREAAGGLEVCVFLVLRQPRSWARSYYVQAVINPPIRLLDFYATGRSFAEFLQHPRIRQLMDHPRLAEDLRAGFGAARVVSAPLEEDWLDRFFAETGLAGLPWHLSEPKNESPPPWAVEILRQVNCFGLPEPRRLAWKAALWELTGSNHALLGRAREQVGAGGIRLETEILDALEPRDDPDFPLPPDRLAALTERADWRGP